MITFDTSSVFARQQEPSRPPNPLIAKQESFRIHQMLQKKWPRVRKIFARNSGAGNGCANFMGTWKKCVLSAEKPHAHKILCLGGGGVFWVWGGGRRECRFYFYGREDFSECYCRFEKSIGNVPATLSQEPQTPCSTIRDTPHIEQFPFEIVSQKGYCMRFALFSDGIAQVSLRYPVLGGITPQVRMLGREVSLPIWPC